MIMIMFVLRGRRWPWLQTRWMNGDCGSGGDWWGQLWSWRLAHTWDIFGWVVQLKYWATHWQSRFYSVLNDAINSVYGPQSFSSSSLLSSEWLTRWLNHWHSHSLTDSCQKKSLTQWHAKWLTEWLRAYLIIRLTYWMTHCLLLLFSRLFACHGSVDWLIPVCSTNRTTGWLRKKKGTQRSGNERTQF